MRLEFGNIALATSFLSLFLVFGLSLFSIKKTAKPRLTTFLYLVHALSVTGAFFYLSFLMLTKQYSYAYVWEHVSNSLENHYIFSATWEGQEGSILLWLFFQSLLGLFLLKENSVFWTVYSSVGLFLNLMILGIDLPFFDLSLGQSPFLLLKEKYTWPIFDLNPNHVPLDGKGLNLLLHNIWMVIHPPIIFLSFAIASIPYSHVTSNLLLSTKPNYKQLKSSLLISLLLLTTGIAMGSYWAYETLNFGGFWSWDPVENAVYVPWLLVLAAFHLSCFTHKSKAALRYTYFFTSIFYLSVLYSTFLTRSGILGDSSVHAFTASGLSNQLLVFLLFFTTVSILALISFSVRNKITEEHLPSIHSIVQIFAIGLACASFQVALGTSFPVFNKLTSLLGTPTNWASPQNPILFYSKFQLFFILVSSLLLCYYYISRNQFKLGYLKPFLACVLAILVVLALDIEGVYYNIAATIFIFTSILTLSHLFSPRSRTASLVSHIGFSLLLVGILVSSVKQETLTHSTKTVQDDFKVVVDNLLIKRNTPTVFGEYGVQYAGTYYRHKDDFIPEEYIIPTTRKNFFVLRKDWGTYTAGETLFLETNNLFYKLILNNTYTGEDKVIFPRIQTNDKMGVVASPIIVHNPMSDLYLHVTNFPNPQEKQKWSTITEHELVNDMVSLQNHNKLILNQKQSVQTLPGYTLQPNETATKYDITLKGLSHSETMLFETYLITDDIGNTKIIPDYSYNSSLRIAVDYNKETGKEILLVSECPKDWIVIKATHFPWVSLIWIGIILCALGMTIRLCAPIVSKIKNHQTSYSNIITAKTGDTYCNPELLKHEN